VGPEAGGPRKQRLAVNSIFNWVTNLDSRQWRAAALIFAFGIRGSGWHPVSIAPASTVFWTEEAERIGQNLYRTGEFARSLCAGPDRVHSP
jgi:hypothetical protein